MVLAISLGVAWVVILGFCFFAVLAGAREDRLRQRLAERAQLELGRLESEGLDDYEDYRGI
jgi:hypothetical protein